jgi:hypothetical protein
MRRIILALCVISIGAVAGAQSSAPNNDELAQSAVGFGFRIGGFFPADSKLRDVQTTFTDFAIEYDMEKSLFSQGTTYIAGDWISDKFIGSQHEASLTINQRYYMNPNGKANRFAVGGTPYFFLGAGGAWTDVSGATGQGLLVRGGFGSEFKGNLFVEVEGQITSRINGVNASGVGVSVGFRFK